MDCKPQAFKLKPVGVHCHLEVDVQSARYAPVTGAALHRVQASLDEPVIILGARSKSRVGPRKCSVRAGADAAGGCIGRVARR